MKYDYNIVVIGAGAAGLVSSYIAAAVKAKVALVEKHKMGGDCLNTGCVPSKALIRSAKILNYISRAKEFGIRHVEAEYDFSDVMQRVHHVVESIAPHDSVERYTDLGVDCYEGEATIVDRHTVKVGDCILTTKSIIIASGAAPLVPPVKGLETVDYYTSDTVWNLHEVPRRFVVLGGGPIGCELAQCFSRFGSEITVVEMGPSLLAREDEEVAHCIVDTFKQEKIRVLTDHKAVEVKHEDGDHYLVCQSGSKRIVIPFDGLLLALGRKARIEAFGLEKLGVKLTGGGTVEADPFLRTNVSNIYVCGDVVGPYQFTHAAGHQAWYAAVNALFSPFKSFKADYRVIPWCTFTDPEVARVGLNEKDAKEQGIDYEVTTYGIDDLDRAIADSQAKGFVKVLTKPGKDKILGVTIVGHHAGDIIAEFVLAMRYNIGLNAILSTIHIYPTLSEANKYVAGKWKQRNAPQWVLNLVEKFHRFRRR